jgi:hypothetical protein
MSKADLSLYPAPYFGTNCLIFPPPPPSQFKWLSVCRTWNIVFDSSICNLLYPMFNGYCGKLSVIDFIMSYLDLGSAYKQQTTYSYESSDSIQTLSEFRLEIMTLVVHQCLTY